MRNYVTAAPEELRDRLHPLDALREGSQQYRRQPLTGLPADTDGDLVIECPLDVVSRIIGRISPIVYTGDPPVNGDHSCRSNVSDSPPSSDTRH